MFRYFQPIYIIVVTDLVISTLFILLFQDDVSGILTANLTIRPVIVLAISLFSFWICRKFKIANRNLELLSSLLVTYLLINLTIFALKSSNKEVIETITAIHTNWILFSSLMLPLIISYGLLIVAKVIWK